MFSGLVFCSDCGAKMNFCSTNNYKESGAYFECSEHWKDRSMCKAHYIREAVLERLVLKHMQVVTDHILRYEDHFRKTMLEKQLVEGQNVIQGLRKQLERDEKRISELKRLFIKIYEDNAGGKLSDERFYLLSQSYETEQKELEAEVVSLQNKIEQQEKHTEGIEKFIRTAKQHVGIEKLDAYVLHELIQGIYVDAPDKSSGKRKQHIHIKYDGVGFIPLSMLMKEETA